MDNIDLRSDTVTRPGPGMRQAMASAEVGDYVFGEDPTVNRLQEKAAGLLGKEAALYVPSGTMANQICLRVLTRPGDEVICDRFAHLYRNEGAAGPTLSGLSFFPLEGNMGRISAAQVAAAVQADNIHLPVSRVVALENTHNRGNGSVYSLESIQAIAAVARKNGLAMHLDGARMFHACLAGGYAAPELAGLFETVSFCLSKGLGAPVGSLVVSTRERVKAAVRVRKQLGGGMRQAGILAAAGLYALEQNIGRLAEDHRRARRLAEALAGMKGVRLDPADCPTNIVIFDVSPSGRTPAQVAAELGQAGVLVLPFGPTAIRAVLHLDVDDSGLTRAIAGFNRVLGSGR
jgi:threonine aldolase